MPATNKNKNQLIKPDLKHDNMEYSAATDGDDLLDTDNETADELEAEEITAAELALLQEDNPGELAAALNSAETDSLADEDNFINEEEDIEEEEDN